MVQASDMTIFGPFGGDLVTNSAEFEARQVDISAKFHSGTAQYELLSTMSSGDLLVLVMAERCEVTFEGHAEPQPWSLRTTQVFRMEDGRWVRLHRHADPLVKRRTFEAALALAADV
jgi:ketosteroid isomerase-like protein